MVRLTTEGFITKAKKVHGDKYDYSKVMYKNNQEKVCIICPEHGEFWQIPNNHMSGKGCPKCGNKVISNKNKKSLENFIEKAIGVHGEFYDYSKSVYIKNNVPLKIICPIHGEFWQTPSDHMNGCGCPKCSGKNMTLDEFLDIASQVHGDKYDYSKTAFKGKCSTVTITCPIHGDFEQKALNHLKGHGCYKCAREKAVTECTDTTEDFILKAKKVHGDYYDYSKVDYKKTKEKVCIICPEHGEFWQTPSKHLQGHGCRKCYGNISKSEIEIAEYIRNTLGLKVDEGVRDIIKPREIDIFIKSKMIGFEYNGLVWHSELFSKGRDYHLSKTDDAFKNGIFLYHIFDDEYINNKELVLRRIGNILLDDECVYDNFEVKIVSFVEIDDFVRQNSFNADVRHTTNYGCFLNGDIVGVVGFREVKNGSWYIENVCSNDKISERNVFYNVLKTFTKSEKPNKVTINCDRRWTDEKFYHTLEKLSFVKQCILEPDFRIYCQNEYGYKRVDKKLFEKDLMVERNGFNENVDIDSMLNDLKAYRIWDCGYYQYVWQNNNN